MNDQKIPSRINLIDSPVGWAPGTKVYFYIKHSIEEYEIDFGYIAQATLNNTQEVFKILDQDLPDKLTFNYKVMSKRHGTRYEDIRNLKSFFLTYNECKECIIKLQTDEVEKLQESISNLQKNLINLEDQ